MDKKEYKELLIKYYSENHSFIEKAIFTVTASAITFLLGYSDKISESFILWYSLCIGLFILTLIIQLISAYISREGCDIGLDESQSEKANQYFSYSEILNNLFMIIFCLSIIATSIVITINSYKTTIKKNYKFEQNIITTDDYEYSERRVFMNKKEYNNGLNPPKSIKTIANDGFNPPKTVTPKPIQQPKENK